MIKLLRLKHKRLPPLTNQIAERRSGCYSGGHFSFTDADFARTPGTRAKLHRSINSPYSNPRSNWGSIPSCDNLPRRAALARNTKASLLDEVRNNSNLEGRRWPVPTRLKRTNAIPLSAIKVSPSVNLTDKSPNHAEISTVKSQVQDPVDRSAKMLTDHKNDPKMVGRLGKLSIDTSPEVTTKPKPLFYSKQRSNSTGVIAQTTEGNSKSASANILPGTQAQLGFPLGRNSCLPRSSSLFTQQPGKAPSIPMPQLPSAVSTKIQNSKGAREIGINRPSNMSLMSEYTSALDSRASRAFSHTGTDFTSANLLSPAASSSATVGLGIDLKGGIWEKSLKLLGTQDSCTQVSSQHSLGMSIQQSLPRDNSSGLRFSMYNHNHPRNESSTTISKDMSPKRNMKAPASAERRPLGLDLPFSRSTDIKDYKGAQTKRASVSIFKDVLGSEGDLSKRQSRASSATIGDAFQLDSDVSAQPSESSARKDGEIKHEQQSCVRLSTPPAVIPPRTTSPNMAREYEIVSRDPPIPGLLRQTSVSYEAISRPSSKTSFSLRFQKSSSRHSFAGEVEGADSPTESMMSLYKHNDNSSPDSIVSTPTRKPSGHNPSTIRSRNNRKSVLLGLRTYDPESAPNLPLFPLTIPPLSPNHAEKSHPSSKNSSLQLSEPLKPLNPASWRKTPLHGPRTPPRRFTSRARRSPTRQLETKRFPSRSPLRGGVEKAQSSPSPSHRSRPLLESIIDLRRMNSEVSKSGAEKAHRRFQSLEAEDLIEEGAGQSEAGGQKESIERLSDDMRMPRYMPEVEIPGLLFAARRNEEGVWEAPKWANRHDDDEIYGDDGFLKD